jgi:RNA polymerase sigma-70 factor (ECF subfamily)
MEFEQIYNTYMTKIFRLCLGYINDEEHARDLTQETFIAVWQNLGTFRNQADIGTWVYKIATNICLRRIEVEKRLKTAPLPATCNAVAETDLTAEERHKQLRACIAELSEIERLVIGLFLEGIPQERIAEIMGMSHSNVRVKVHRIKEVLTQKMKKNGWL